MSTATLLRDLARLREELAACRPTAPPAAPYPQYADDPCGFSRDVLRVRWTATQEAIARAMLEPPFRVLVLAGHNVGKTHLSAGISLWWHLTRRPSIVLTTAPKLDQVKKLLWKEIRTQGRGLVPFAGPSAPYVERAADDFMLGTTARDGTAFQGHHGPELLFVFDEAVGVDQIGRASC